MTKGIQLPLSVTITGVEWHLFSIEFKTADGTYSTYIYAVSHEHAQAILSDLKDTATVQGQVVGLVG